MRWNIGFSSSGTLGRFHAVSMLALFAISLAPLRAQEAAPPPPPPGGGEHRPMPKPTNLKVLPKDISSEDLMKIMHGYTQALGVHCTFCHAVDAQTGHPNFASDAKPEKATARTMIAMNNEINEKYLSQIHDPDAKPDQKTVTCGTCHRGESMPSAFVPPPTEHPSMPVKP